VSVFCKSDLQDEMFVRNLLKFSYNVGVIAD
jgi:hypothetical protein